MLLGALAEGFGLLMIVPLASIAINGGGALLRFAPWIAAWPVERRFTVALALFVAMMAVRSITLFARDTLLARLNADYEASLRLRAASTLAHRGWPFASKIGQAGMQSLLLNEVPRAGEAASFATQISISVIMLLVQLALTSYLSPGLTLVALAFLAAGSILSLRFTRRGVSSGLAIVNAMGESAGSGFRLHAGLKAALAQGTTAAFLDEYRSSLHRTAGQFTRFARDYSFAQQSAAFGAAIVAAVLLLVGVKLLALPFPVLAASLVLFARMSGPAQALQSNLLRFAAYRPAFAAIEQRLGQLDAGIPAQLNREPLEWQRLTVKEASFEHGPGMGLPAGSLAFRRGEWVGISGQSGAGKTTFLDLVSGLLVPQSGTLEVDGHPLAGETLARWRAGLAYIGQDGNVFNDSIRSNLLADGAEADEADLWEVLGLVGLAQRIRALPSGLDEGVGDRGSHLSGGERQRLVLARALLRKPSLLILDEGTSALDQQGEGAILERIKGIEPRPSALVVAHRESTLRHCDSLFAIQHSPSKGTES
jgi:ATP-binding cassette subfamily C protein